MFASLNIGLQRAQACGRRADRRFRAIARAVREAFYTVKVTAIGLVEVGDAIQGLPAERSARLIEVIRAEMPDTVLLVHADAVGHPYMLLSLRRRVIEDIRVIDSFVSQKRRKALRATLLAPDGDGASSLSVDLWLVHLASSKNHPLTASVRNQMLSKLKGDRPTLITGDLNTMEFMIRAWIQNEGRAFHSLLAQSPANTVRHGDYAVSANVYMWTVDHRIGKTFEPEDSEQIDRSSDAHDMVCVALVKLDSHDRSRLAELGDDAATADAAELGDPIVDLDMEPAEVSRIRGQAVLAVTSAQHSLCEDFWKGKFEKQRLTQQQAAQDRADGYNSTQRKKRMRGRWYAYQNRALGERKLGWALITFGFDVDMKTLAAEFARAKQDGDAQSSPANLRKRVLAMRSWYRWGRQLHDRVRANPGVWDALGPQAQNCWRWFDRGWSAEESDKLTKQYGHGMLRTGPDRGLHLGQGAHGFTVDRMRGQMPAPALPL